MSLHLQRQIDGLKRKVLALGAKVEEMVQGAIESIEQRNPDLARRIIQRDEEVDATEIEVEEECLHTLALHQPVAFDIRYVVAVMKINNELERIADLAVNIAEQAVFLSQNPSLPRAPFDLSGMTTLVRKMVRQSLDSLVTIDPNLAEDVRQLDDHVDAIHRQMYERVEAGIREKPEMVCTFIHYLNVSRNLERIADHAVNVAEDVIYTARGDILRHNRPHPLAEGNQQQE